MDDTWLWYVYMRNARNESHFERLNPSMSSRLTYDAATTGISGYTTMEFPFELCQSTSFGTSEDHTMQHAMNRNMPMALNVPIVAGGVVKRVKMDKCVVKLFMPLFQDTKLQKEEKAPVLVAADTLPHSVWVQTSMILSELRQLRHDWVLQARKGTQPYVQEMLANSNKFQERQRYKALLWLLTMDDELLNRLEHSTVYQFIHTQFHQAMMTWLQQTHASLDTKTMNQFLTVLAGNTTDCILPPEVQTCLQRCVERVRSLPQPKTDSDLHPLQVQFMADVNQALECAADRQVAPLDNVISLAVFMALARLEISVDTMWTKLQGLVPGVSSSDPQPPGGMLPKDSKTPDDMSKPELNDPALERALQQVVHYAKTMDCSVPEKLPTSMPGECRSQ